MDLLRLDLLKFQTLKLKTVSNARQQGKSPSESGSLPKKILLLRILIFCLLFH